MYLLITLLKGSPKQGPELSWCFPSHLCPGVPSRIPPSLPRISLMEEDRRAKRPPQTLQIMTVSHIVQGLAVDLRGGRCQKTSCQVWNCESAQRRGGVFADRPLVHPETPTPSLWCLCVFVNEEILIPWWDIALSWADSASSVPSYSRPTHPQSHHASGFTSLAVNGTNWSLGNYNDPQLTFERQISIHY